MTQSLTTLDAWIFILEEFSTGRSWKATFYEDNTILANLDRTTLPITKADMLQTLSQKTALSPAPQHIQLANKFGSLDLSLTPHPTSFDVSCNAYSWAQGKSGHTKLALLALFDRKNIRYTIPA